jgi:hypothetical protein
MSGILSELLCQYSQDCLCLKINFQDSVPEIFLSPMIGSYEKDAQIQPKAESGCHVSQCHNRHVYISGWTLVSY